MNDPERFGLSQATLDKLNGVFAKHGAIERVLMYGSRAKGNYRHGSDIDLTILGEEIPFDEFMAIEDQIDDLMLPYTVGLSQYRQIANPELIAHMDRVGVAIYDRAAQGKYRHTREGGIQTVDSTGFPPTRERRNPNKSAVP